MGIDWIWILTSTRKVQQKHAHQSRNSQSNVLVPRKEQQGTRTESELLRVRVDLLQSGVARSLELAETSDQSYGALRNTAVGVGATEADGDSSHGSGDGSKLRKYRGVSKGSTENGPR